MNVKQKDLSQFDNIKRFYNDVYYKDKESKKTKPNTHLKRLIRKIPINRQSKILDVACGTGEWLRVCRDAGANVSGVDISDKAIGVCREIIPEGTFFVQPAEELPFEDNFFDVVTCLGSLEHFLQPKQALKEMIRVGKSDAVFILLVPNADFLTRKLGLYSGTYQVNVHEEVRTLEEWERLFAGAGLKVIKCWKDLHVLSWRWILLDKFYKWPFRALQAFMLALWPLRWQYQVYYKCVTKKEQNQIIK